MLRHIFFGIVGALIALYCYQSTQERKDGSEAGENGSKQKEMISQEITQSEETEKIKKEEES